MTAFHVWRESERRLRRRSQVESTYLRLAERADPEGAEESRHRLEVLQEAIDALSPEERELVVTYYQGSGRDRIRKRKQLARTLGISLINLRVRAFRIRAKLEAGIAEERRD